VTLTAVRHDPPVSESRGEWPAYGRQTSIASAIPDTSARRKKKKKSLARPRMGIGSAVGETRSPAWLPERCSDVEQADNRDQADATGPFRWGATRCHSRAEMADLVQACLRSARAQPRLGRQFRGGRGGGGRVERRGVAQDCRLFSSERRAQTHLGRLRLTKTHRAKNSGGRMAAQYNASARAAAPELGR